MNRQEQIRELIHLRTLASHIFTATPIHRDNMLASMATNNAKGERQLKRSSGKWATEVTATETQRAKFSSIPLNNQDYDKARHVRRLHTLSPRHIAAIKAKSHPDKSIRDESQKPYIFEVMERATKDRPRRRGTIEFICLCAKLMLSSPRHIKAPWELFEDTQDNWRNSNARRLWNETERLMREIELEALKTWLDR